MLVNAKATVISADVPATNGMIQHLGRTGTGGGGPMDLWNGSVHSHGGFHSQTVLEMDDDWGYPHDSGNKHILIHGFNGAHWINDTYL